MELLINRRNLQRQLIAGAAGYTKKEEFFQRTIVQLEKRLDVLNQNYNDFMEEQRALMEQMANEDELNEQNQIAADTQERFIETAAVLEQR